MPIEPRGREEVYTDVRDDLEGRVDQLSNFVDGSFNNEFLYAYSDQIREAEIKALASELAGTVDYAGKDLTQEDLNRLDIENVDPEEINEYMHESHLDNLAANFGVVRDQGQRATVAVDIQTADDTVEISEGFLVSTQPDGNGNTLDFRCDVDEDGEIDENSTATVSPSSGETTITVTAIADDVGTEYNVVPGQITHIPNPKPGVQGVTNAVESSGGTDEQENETLRDDVKNALFESAGGGTESGVIGTIDTNSETVSSVGIEEYTDQSPPFVDVIVDGGEEDYITELIEQSRPLGIQHNLIRPHRVSLGIHSHIVGTDVDSTNVEDTIIDEIEDYSISDTFYWSSILNTVSQSDQSVVSVPVLNTYYDRINNERVFYDSTQSIYQLDFSPFGVIYSEEHIAGPYQTDYETMYSGIDPSKVSVQVVVDDEGVDVSGDGFSVIDADNDGVNDTISLDSSIEPDEGTTTQIDYEHSSGSLQSVTSMDGEEYVKGTDYQVIDDDGDGRIDSIEWLDGGSTPADGDRFKMEYRPMRSFSGDAVANDDQRFSVYEDNIDLTIYQE